MSGLLDEETRIEVAFCLGKIDPGNQTAISNADLLANETREREIALKGFPPNQRNLISASETWLGEI
ncbi:hypothetical protein NEA10_07890 [Phormidium yuhuli AB48]|uniref:Uncharacterized protein n=1 Tax=Phormidium yuhuli AB48 TaxID=2940671 RepID=A0ABY5ATT4_9CYAN|nr:hypothetical protein [Phormidium yuhuli]USR92629.1 hypothetical protein NEA10_07890 [Phormidium yuhuli AB48]